ncbi:hypothetical protein HDU98_005476 [Podochytrium sp. JEL0797]|nr:hypothetical protein HDU98_005476 [Podochytrium sp. JEL0797]
MTPGKGTRDARAPALADQRCGVNHHKLTTKVKVSKSAFKREIATFTTRAAQIHVEYQGKDNRMAMAGFSSNSAHVYLRNFETGARVGVLDGEIQRTTYVKDPNGVSNNTLFIWGGKGYDMNANLTGPYTPPSLLPTGNYIMRFLGLKNFGDVTRIDDYDVLETPIFNLVY